MTKKKNEPLVSVIIPTYNSQKYIDDCLKSIMNQSYKNIEIIVVDNHSKDNTQQIVKNYRVTLYKKGPERSAQVNYGVKKAKGTLIYKVDSDFVLEPDVIRECVDSINMGYDAVCVHNEPDINISWIAKIRKFETDMYYNDLTFSSARFMKKNIFLKIGGFNEKITAGEDFDLQNKLNNLGYKTTFIKSKAIHKGEPTNIFLHLKKYFIYGQDFINYYHTNKVESKKQLSPLRIVYLKNWKKFLNNPILGFTFILYTFFKFTAGGLGFIFAVIENNLKYVAKHIRKSN